MNSEGNLPESSPVPGPIEYDYLHGNVHPLPPVEKAEHEHKLGESTLFPETGGTPPVASEDDSWMFT